MLWFFEKIVIGVETFGVNKNINEAEKAKLLKTKIYYSDYLPLESMSSLIPNPLVRTKMAQMIGMDFKFDYPVYSVIACLVWSLIFIGGSYLILKKKDW